jgi:hypothetical protein
MQGDEERTIERRGKLEKMVRETFRKEEIEVFTKEEAKKYPWGDQAWRISITSIEKPPVWVVIKPTPGFERYKDIDFVGISRQAIEEANKILRSPPRRENFQGTILVDYNRIKFYEGE